MRRTTIMNASEVRRKPFNEAKNELLKHCRIKNLRPRTITYYGEDNGLCRTLHLGTGILQLYHAAEDAVLFFKQLGRSALLGNCAIRQDVDLMCQYLTLPAFRRSSFDIGKS